MDGATARVLAPQAGRKRQDVETPARVGSTPGLRPINPQTLAARAHVRVPAAARGRIQGAVAVGRTTEITVGGGDRQAPLFQRAERVPSRTRTRLKERERLWDASINHATRAVTAR